MVSVSVPEHYGFVCLMLVASLLISVYLGIKVRVCGGADSH